MIKNRSNEEKRARMFTWIGVSQKIRHIGVDQVAAILPTLAPKHAEVLVYQIVNNDAVSWYDKYQGLMVELMLGKHSVRFIVPHVHAWDNGLGGMHVTGAAITTLHQCCSALFDYGIDPVIDEWADIATIK